MRGLRSITVPEPGAALPGRATPIAAAARHAVLETPMEPPFAAGSEIATFGLGCFWGAERIFWQLPGVLSTQVGYAGGQTPNPTYDEVCSGATGHTEVVRVVFDPTVIAYEELVARFFEGHDPTQGMRQGNDVGTQYRSAIYTESPAQAEVARAIADEYGARLAQRGLGPITTEIAPAGPFYHAEEYHQQYLHKVPNGYCGIGGTGVSCPRGVSAAER